MKSKSTRQSKAPSAQSSTRWTPHAYQRKAVRFLLEHAAAALFLDPGLGKTSITLAAIKFLKAKGLVDKVLLIAPLRVCHAVWPSETRKWDDFHGLRVAVLHGKHKEAALASDADIYVINPEGLEWLLQVQKTKGPTGKTRVSVDIRRWKSLGFDTLVVDELSKFKHTNTNRFKAIKLVLHTFGRRWGLTGSPASNGLLDLFGQCFVLDQGRTLGPYITHYRLKYFVPSYDGFSWTLREGADQEIYERIRPLALRMAAEDYLDMPKIIENNIMVQLPEPIMKVYQALENDLVAKIEAGTVRAANAAAASMKCRQVASGGIYLDQEVKALVKLPKSEREWADLHEAKLDALDELFEELQGNPILVAYDFNHDLERIKGRFGKDVAVIGGGYDPKQTGKIIQRWNAGDIDKLFCHPAAAAHGLDGLQYVGRHIAWHTLTWDYELYLQLIRRIVRQGSTADRAFVHHIMAAGTIDQIMLMSLKAKAKGQNALFQALQTLRRR